MNEKSDGNNADNIDSAITSISFAGETNNGSTQKDCEMNSGRIAEKRAREKSDESCSEDGFITFTRRRPKRLLRSESGIEGESGKEIREGNLDENYKISLTSLEVLPKQMALAKLLKNENIQNILRINYKSPYRVVIQIAKKEDGEKLIKCQKLIELGIRIQFVNQLDLSYGIIKGVDLELSESEILESLETSCKILSVRRLRRISQDREWVDSETVRVCFESPTTPEFILAYGCRFRVERYIFPVSQCSNCWKFGHIKKFCPTKKIRCPKCGKEHENCETDRVVCPNCKGPHMALDKTCPAFLKEKEIRTLMSVRNISYRKALEIYLKDNNKGKRFTKISPDLDEKTEESPITLKKTYSSVLQSAVPVEEVLSNESACNQTEILEIRQKQKVNRSKKQNKYKDRQENQTNLMETEWENFSIEDDMIENSQENRRSEKEEAEKKKQRKHRFIEIFLKIKEIIYSEEGFEVKIMSVLKVMYEECKVIVRNFLLGGNLCQWFFKYING